MRLLSTCTMANELLSIRTMTNDDAKHKTMPMRLLSTRTMTNDVAKHKKNDRRGC